MRLLIIIVVILSVDVDRQGFDLNHAFSLSSAKEDISWKPVLLAVLRIGKVLKTNI